MAISYLGLNPGNHVFTTVLGDNTFEMRVLYRDADFGGWYLDMINTISNVGIYGIPIISGVDVLAQFQHLNWGHLRFDFDPKIGNVPTFDEMGNGVTMIWSEDGF